MIPSLGASEESKTLEEIWKGNIPEYLAEAFIEVSNNMIPFWLGRDDGGRETRYMVVGGRAVNVYSKTPLPSNDWDIIVITSDKAETERFTADLTSFLSVVVSADPKLSSVVNGIESFSIKLGGGGDSNILWRIAIRDNFTELKFPVVDIKMCPQEKGGAIGDICNWYAGAVTEVDNVFYAPRDMVVLDLERITRIREDLYNEVVSELVENEINLTNVEDKIARLLLSPKGNAGKKVLDLMRRKDDLLVDGLRKKLYASNYDLKYKRQIYRNKKFN